MKFLRGKTIDSQLNRLAFAQALLFGTAVGSGIMAISLSIKDWENTASTIMIGIFAFSALLGILLGWANR